MFSDIVWLKGHIEGNHFWTFHCEWGRTMLNKYRNSREHPGESGTIGIFPFTENYRIPLQWKPVRISDQSYWKKMFYIFNILYKTQSIFVTDLNKVGWFWQYISKLWKYTQKNTLYNQIIELILKSKKKLCKCASSDLK